MIGLLLAAAAAVAADPAMPAEVYVSTAGEETMRLFADEALQGDALVAQLEAMRSAGDDGAGELLVELHQFGVRGVARNRGKACDYAEPIAPRRPDAAHNLATCYFTGAGRPRDLALARHWYERAAQGGFLKARCALGNMLMEGQGGPVDEARAIALCRSGAELGQVDAMTDLGGYLLVGRGTARDPVEARRLLTAAAAKGQANALFLLAEIYFKGDGTAQDYAAAASLLERAFAAGRKDAAWTAAVSHLKTGSSGTGAKVRYLPESAARALPWFETASREDPDLVIRKQAQAMVAAARQIMAQRQAAD